MKLCITGILLFLTVAVSAQAKNRTYNWFNAQYNANNFTNDWLSDYFAISGGVEYITEEETDYLSNGAKCTKQKTYRYRLDGRISEMHELQDDGSKLLQSFCYSEKGDFKFKTQIYLFNKGESLDTIQMDTFFVFREDIVADSIQKNANGNVIYYALNGAETFSLFDDYGRKSQDSIPSNHQNSEHIIRYEYGMMKITKKISYPKEDLHLKIIYWIDKKGNWTHCSVQANKFNKNASISRSIVYYE